MTLLVENLALIAILRKKYHMSSKIFLLAYRNFDNSWAEYSLFSLINFNVW